MVVYVITVYGMSLSSKEQVVSGECMVVIIKGTVAPSQPGVSGRRLCGAEEQTGVCTVLTLSALSRAFRLWVGVISMLF